MKPTSRNILEYGHLLITALSFPSFCFLKRGKNGSVDKSVHSKDCLKNVECLL